LPTIKTLSQLFSPIYCSRCNGDFTLNMKKTHLIPKSIISDVIESAKNKQVFMEFCRK